MQGQRERRATGEPPLPDCFGLISPAHSTLSVFSSFPSSHLEELPGFNSFPNRRTVLGTAEHGRGPRESREEPEESMESPRVLHGHLKAGCAEQSNPPSLLLPQPKASPVLKTLICKTNQPCDSAITFSVTKTLLSCFFSLKCSFPQSLLFGNTKAELETPTSAKRTIPLPPPFTEDLIINKIHYNPKPQRKQRVQPGL